MKNGYRMFREWKRGKGKRRSSLRILSAGLSLSMLLTGCGSASVAPVAVPEGVEQLEAALQQESGDNEAAGCKDTLITGFVSLSEDMREQTVPLGTMIEELNLPDTLEAYVAVNEASNEEGGIKPPADSEETSGDDNDEETSDEGENNDEETSGEGENNDEETPGEGENNDDGIPGEGDGNDDRIPGEGENNGDGTSGEDDNKGGEPPGGDDSTGGGIPGGDNGDGENSDSTCDSENGGDNGGADGGDGSESGIGGGGEEPSGDGDAMSTDGGDSGAEPEASDGEAPASSDNADDTASAGCSVETGSFVMPIYASENPQDGLTAGTLTDSTDDADTTGGDDAGAADTQTGADGTDAADTQEKTVTIGNVTWESDPAYDGDTEGIYLFTAVLPDGYVLSEGVSLPQITVTADGTAALIQALLARIAALPDAQEYMEEEPDIDDWEDDEDGYEEAYTEWMEGLQEYAEEALAIQKEIEKLTQEQQALIPQEAFDKLTAWVKIAAQVLENSMVMATADTHTCSGIVFQPWTATDRLPDTGNYYLTEDVVLDANIAAVISDGKELKLCLHGKKIRGENRSTAIFLVKGGTLKLYDCTGTGSVYCTGEHNPISVSGGGSFHLYGGTVEHGGELSAVAVVKGDGNPGSTVNVYGGTIKGGTIKGGIGVNSGLTGVSVFVRGGTVTGSHGITISSGNLTITGGTVTGGTYYGVWVLGDGSEVAVSGGEVSGGQVGANVQSGNLTVSGGAINGGSSYAVWMQDTGKVTVAGNATLNTAIYSTCQNGITASGTGQSGLSTVYSIKYSDGKVTNDQVIVQGSTDTDHYQLVSDTFGLAAKNGNLVARGKYTVTYQENGGTITEKDKYTSYVYGVGLTLPTSTAITRTGYSFGGWYDNPSCTGTAVTSISVTAEGDKTYYAKWTANTYTVEYNGNGKTEGSTADSTHEYDTTKTLTANGYKRSYTVTFNHNYTGSADMTKTATYTFAGWNTAVNGSGTSYNDKASVKNLTSTNNGTVTLYARWTSKSVTYTPTRTGYTFVGWYTGSNCSGSRVDNNGAYTPTANIMLYACWKDTAPPSAPILQNGVTLPTGWTKTQTTIPLTLYDNAGVTELLVSIDGSATYAKVSGFTGGSGTAAYNYAVVEGEHTYQFKAKDAAGNTSAASVVFTVKLDTESPVFQKNPTAGSVTSNSAVVTFTSSESGKAYWIADPAGTPDSAQAVVTGAQGSADSGGVKEITGGAAANIAITGLTPGTAHKVYVALEDAAGNLSEVKAVTFGTLSNVPGITIGDLEKDYVNERVKVPESFGKVEVYTDPDDPAGSIIPPGNDGFLPVEPGTSIYIRYPEKNDGGQTILASGGAKIDIPGRPAAPPAKEVTVTDTTVTVKDPAAGEQYILVPKGQTPDWSDADEVNETGVFIGLDPNEEYDLYVRKKATEDDFASEPAKNEVRTSVTINEPEITGDGAGKDGNTAPKPDRPDEGSDTVTYTGTYGEEYTPVIKVGGKEIIPGADTPDAEGSEMTWDDDNKSGEWEYTYEIPDGVSEVDITVEFRKRALTGITAQPNSLTIFADDAANQDAAQTGDVSPLTAYLKEECTVKAAYDNRTTGEAQADAVTYTTTDTFAPKGATYHYTISAGGKTCTAALTVNPVTASVRNPNTVLQRQKDGGYTAQEVGAWLPAQVMVTYTGTGYTERTETLAVTWDADSLGADFGGTPGEKAINGTVELPAWAAGQDSVSIGIRFVEKTLLSDDQIRLSIPDFSYGDQKLPGTQGSITVEDTNPAYTYLYSTDGGAAWTTEDQLPKSDSGYIVPGEYKVKVTYRGDSYTGTKEASFTVAKRTVTVQKGTLEAVSRKYDGTTDAVLKEGGAPALSGVVEGDKVKPGGTLEAHFAEKGPKKNIPVNVTGFSLEGADSAYYELGNTTVTLYATISKSSSGGGNSSSDSGGENGGSGANGTSGGDNNGGSGSGDNGSGTKPGEGTKPGSSNGGEGDGTKPGGNNGGEGDVMKPGGNHGGDRDGTKPGGNNGGKGDGTKPGGNNDGNSDGTKPGGNHGGEGDRTKPGEDTKPGDNSSGDGEGETKIVSAVIEDGRIVIDGGSIGGGNDGNDGNTGGSGNGGEGAANVPGADGGKIATGNVPGMAGAGEGLQDGTGTAGACTASTQLNVGEGAVIVRVVCEEPKLTAGVADTVAVVNAVLTTEQVQLADSGDTIEIRMEVKDITGDVAGQDREVIESAVTRLREGQEGMTLGMYVDISMFVKVGGGEWNAVTRSNEPIEVVIGIPEEIRADGRAYYVIRSHEGEYDILTDRDDVPDTITIITDKFSAYAIAYEQTDGAGADSGQKCGRCHICPTFLGVCCFAWLAIIILVAIVMMILLRKKREEWEN